MLFARVWLVNRWLAGKRKQPTNSCSSLKSGFGSRLMRLLSVWLVALEAASFASIAFFAKSWATVQPN
jgi:hypothetical protein